MIAISFETSKCWLGVLSSSNTSRIFYKLSNKYVFKYVWRFKVLSIFRALAGYHYKTHTWVKVFNNGPSKIYGRELLKNLKGYVCLSRPYPFKFCKGCLPQILLGSFFNTLFHLTPFKEVTLTSDKPAKFTCWQSTTETLEIGVKYVQN